MKVERFKLPLRLNIQQFADDNGGADNGNGEGDAPKTYSQEEYDKVQSELAKFKAALDKTSSELATEKKRAKAKLSEEEKKAQEDEEKNKKFTEMETTIRKYELKDSLSKSFEGETLDSLTDAIIGNDYKKIAEIIAKNHEEFKKVTIENAKKEFSKSSTLPGGNSSEADDVITKLAKKQSEKKENQQDNWNKRKR